MRVLNSSHLVTGRSPSSLSVFVWISHQVKAWPSNFNLANEIFCSSSIWWTLQYNSSCCRQWFNFNASISPWYDFYVHFCFILNMDCEGLMVLKFDWSFSDSFYDSFLESSWSPNFASVLIYELEPSSSPNSPRFLARDAMRRFILWLMLKTCASNLSNLSFAGSRGLLWTESSAMTRVFATSL